MLLHFLSLDSVHHQYDQGLAATSAIAFLDSCVEKVVAAVHEWAWTIARLSCGRGPRFKGTQGDSSGNRPRGGGPHRQSSRDTGRGTAMVYVGSAEVLPQAVKALEGLEGIGQVIAQDGFAALGLPCPRRTRR